MLETTTKEIDLPLWSIETQEKIDQIFLRDHERLERLVENRPTIEALAANISNDGVIVVDFGPVVGYLCNGASETAIDKINAYKQMESHTFALVTTPSLFPRFVDREHSPSEFYARAQNQTLPEGIHFRVRTSETIHYDEDTIVPVPSDCFSKATVDGRDVPIIQIALFGDDASPELAYLIQTLWHTHHVPFVIATSANIHGNSELSVYRKGQELATMHGLPFLNAGPDAKLDEIAGSYGGIHVQPTSSSESFFKVVSLFRHGHFDTSHIRHLLDVPTIVIDENISPPRFAYPHLENAVLEWVFKQPARLRLQLLHAIVGHESV